MKKIVLLLALFISTTFANTFTSIIQNVSLPNVEKAIEDTKSLKKSYKKEDFKALVKSWKMVQTLYLAGELNDDYIDTPRYIDIFHHGNENIHKQLNRIEKSNESDIALALFKNSNKSINAVEYMLYKDESLVSKEKAMIDVMLGAILAHLNDIKNIYTSYLNAEEKSEKWGNAVVINALIDSTYKLKEWRVGDAAGLSKKYKGKPDNKRGEYYLSAQSFEAIKAILEAHEQIIGKQKFANLASMAIESGAKTQIREVRESLNNAKNELAKLKTDDFSNAKKLFEALSIFHNAYYLSLIEQLSVTAKILDADGD